MNKIIFTVLFIVTMGQTYAQESEFYKNHAFRTYGSFGYDIGGMELTAIGFNVGGGLSYTYEFGKIDSPYFVGVSVDTQVGAVGIIGLSSEPLFFNFQSSFGVGWHCEDGGRMFFDIVGVGYALLNRSFTSYENNGYGKVLIDKNTTATGVLVNAFSFHKTTSTGFYFSWRNNVMFYNKYRSTKTHESGVVEKFQSSFFDFEYRSYFTFGFDFSKKYNPKAYQKRLF